MAGRNFYRYASGYNKKVGGTTFYRMAGGETLGNTSLTFNGATEPGEFECKIYVTDFSNAPRIFAQDSGGMRVWFNATGASASRLDFKMAEATVLTGPTLNLNTVYTIRVTWTVTGGANGTGQLGIYSNGVLANFTDRPTPLTSLLQDFYLGGYDTGTNQLNGEIWSAKFTKNGTLTADWPLINESFADSSGNGYTLSSVNRGGASGAWTAASHNA